MAAASPSEVFVDTGALIALIDERDNLHRVATMYYRSLSKNTLLITSLLVISETYTWLRYHAGFQPALRFLKVIEKSSATNALMVLNHKRFLNLNRHRTILTTRVLSKSQVKS